MYRDGRASLRDLNLQKFRPYTLGVKETIIKSFGTMLFLEASMLFPNLPYRWNQDVGDDFWS